MAGNSGFFGFAPEASQFNPRTEKTYSHLHNLQSGMMLQMRKPQRSFARAWDVDSGFQFPADVSDTPHAICGVRNLLEDHREIQILPTPAGTALLGIGVTAPAAGGTLSSQDGTNGPYIQYLTSTVLNNAAGWTFANGFRVNVGTWQTMDIPAVAIFRIRQQGSDTSNTNIRLWIGMFSADPSGSDDPAVHLAGFRYSAGASASQWACCVNNGGTTQVRSTRFGSTSGGVPTTMNDFVMRIEFYGHHRSNSGGGNGRIKFFINDVFVGEFKSSLPTTFLAPLVRVTNLLGGAGSAKLVWFSRFAYFSH